jgi:hypothetical protein
MMLNAANSATQSTPAVETIDVVLVDGVGNWWPTAIRPEHIEPGGRYQLAPRFSKTDQWLFDELSRIYGRRSALHVMVLGPLDTFEFSREVDPQRRPIFRLLRNGQITRAALRGEAKR